MPRTPPPRLYLDWNAGAPTSLAARRAVLAALEAGGNASSVHAEGRASRAIVERCRAKLALRFGVAPDAVTFTSGGTEANTTVLSPGVTGRGGRGVERLVVGATEHPSVVAGGRFIGRDVTLVGADGAGRLDLAAYDEVLARDARPALISVMAANNETGVIQSLGAVQARSREAERGDDVLHTDAVQAFGRLPERDILGDVVTISGHKIGAPAGVGAIIRRGDVAVPALVRGGGQERGARGGTENVAAIAGLDAALDEPAADPSAWAETSAARDEFEADLLDAFANATIFGYDAPRLPNTSLFALGVPAEVALIGLDLAGFAVSSGAACSSGKVGPSHVLAAMGVAPELARCAIRVSVGPTGAREALRRFLMALRQVIVPMST
ncbi:cysteine desulfurase family protein [Acuticoccus sp.]|uniref:cysteine desulfurase family protein n=1 Tax=Acuticoccus sp. TaxID=1904378 RepID=UPI003B522533